MSLLWETCISKDGEQLRVNRESVIFLVSLIAAVLCTDVFQTPGSGVEDEETHFLTLRGWMKVFLVFEWVGGPASEY